MYSKEEAYSKIAELTDRFSFQIDNYKRGDYNETQTRKDFIDPFFEALGWDMNNKNGAWEAYREVIHEDKLKVGGVTTAPDYSFRLTGGQRLFFVEAKKPSIVIKDDVAPAYQVRLYGWNAKLAISVVTDFEEFAVYECNKKPLKTDKASKARVNYYTYKDYLKEFDFFWNTFSKQQVIKGGLIKFQQSDKKGTATVDKDFLESLDVWRKELASNIYKNNEGINEDELNYAVQQTIDRIIFLRIAEDRGLEPYGQLKSSLQNTEQYKELYRQFRIADDKYNSGLFHFKKEKDNSKEPDNISGKLIIENKIIKSIINSLYPPQSEFLFNVMPVEILGSAYEQFLGKQIIVKGSRATIEEKPEVRKAGGVYYTPQYIVEYIVENTIGKLIRDLEEKYSSKSSPSGGGLVGAVSKLKIVDPACGSGSFLLGAYQYLLQWHSKYYTSNPQTGKQKDAVLTPDGSLTTAEKKRILLNNIYGVDIDRNATEVTKLSLLLKCMEGETTASVNTQMTFFHERILPSLENNIKSGNSLIDVDFYDTEFDFGEEKKIKPFNWQQGFPEVFKQGGFDCVIGNPPWGADLSDDLLAYLRKKNSSIIVRMIDTYMYFINHSIQLLKTDGSFGMIIPSTFLNQGDMQLLRKLIAEKLDLQIVINLGEKVFGPKVLNTSTILVFTKSTSKNKEIIVADLRLNNSEEKANILNELKSIDKSQWLELVNVNPQSTYFTFNTSNVILLNKLKNKFLPFSKIIEGEIQRGISPDYAKAFVISESEAAHKKIEREILRPLVLGKHISRYSNIESSDLIIYLTSKDDINDYPNAKAHLLLFKKFITCREVAEGKHPWYSLHRPRNPNIFLANKFIGLTTTKKLCIAYDEVGYYTTDALYVFKTKPEINEQVILAIVLSKVFQFLYDTAIQGGQRVIPQVKAVYLYDLPFPNLKVDNSGKHLYDEIVKLVETILQLNKEKQQTTTPDKLEQLNTRIQYTDDKINKLVYSLYGLNEEEVAIVEGR